MPLLLLTLLMLLLLMLMLLMLLPLTLTLTIRQLTKKKQAILDAAASPYAQLFATSSLTKLLVSTGRFPNPTHTVVPKLVTVQTDYPECCPYIVQYTSNTRPTNGLTLSFTYRKTDHPNTPSGLRSDTRKYCVGFLASKSDALESFVLIAQIQLLSRVIKTGWLDDPDAHETILDEVMDFLKQPGEGHYLVGLKIFNQLVMEMNQQTPGTSLISQRKIAVSFRHDALLRLFRVALQGLQSLMEGGGGALADTQNPGQNTTSLKPKLREQCVKLTLNCLSYDFVGTSLDESTEDIGTIQVPSSWRELIEEPATTNLLLDVYKRNAPPTSSCALECLVRLASVRRSLFASEVERNEYLRRLINGTSDILSKNQGLGEHDNYHEFCRLLSRLKTNYQLSELVAVDGYQKWIQGVAEFTLTSLQSWQWASSSVYYLLTLWSRLISSVPYLKGEAPSMLDQYVPKITETFITSRLDSVTAVARYVLGLSQILTHLLMPLFDVHGRHYKEVHYW